MAVNFTAKLDWLSWRPFGPLDFVLRALRALRPCDPRFGDWIVCRVCRRRLREHVVGTSVSLPRGLSTRETDSTHISQLKTPHLDKLIESKWARGQGAARGWTESWQGAERKELR